MRWIWAAVPALALVFWVGESPHHGAAPVEPREGHVTPAMASGPQEFDRLVDEFLAFYLWLNPTRATALGIHDYDGRLPDLSHEGIQAAAAAYRRWLQRLQAIDRSRLSGDAYWDYQILEHSIRTELLGLEEMRARERNPLLYVHVLTGGLAPLTSPDAAPATDRLRAIIQRERQIPSLLAEARRNLANPPRIFTELATRRARAALTFLRQEVPAAFRNPEAGPLADEFRPVHDAALVELEAFVAYLEDEVLARSNGNFRLGVELLERRMRLEQYIDLRVPELLTLTDREITRYRTWIEGEARRLDPSRPAAEVIAGFARDHPPADSILDAARALMSSARTFVQDRGILTLPAREEPLVRAVPGSATRCSAYLLVAGPLAPRATRAVYHLQLPQPDWPPEQVAEHLSAFNRAALAIITSHETFPGHYVQRLALHEAPGPVRRVFQPESLAEGWAHYAEEMMLDAGFGGRDPRLRIVQLRRALEHLARLRVALLMHARGASVEDAAREFAQIAYLEPAAALRETERGTHDPLYGVSTLGKMQILELRHDYQLYLQRRGESASPRTFHDRLLRTGAPVAIARRILLAGENSTGRE